MSRPLNEVAILILEQLDSKDSIPFSALHKIAAPALPYKEFYNSCFRLAASGLIKKLGKNNMLTAQITKEGKNLLLRIKPKKDGVWKLVIFDIPEKQKKVRVVLRAKLKQLNFKKWQNSIWISPYALDKEIEEELNELGKKFFIRLIKTTDINRAEDLEKLFE